MRFVSISEVVNIFRDRSVVIVGSGPSCAQNPPEFVDRHDLVVRVNNYRIGIGQGKRCDVFYSFFGSSIRKTAAQLLKDGVRLCMCKCPNSKPVESMWHDINGKQNGVDFRYIYRARAQWWPCDTYVPDDEMFLRNFNLLGRHIPTTGFAAILDVLRCGPRSVTLTGFDFFASGLHNVSEKWRPGDPNDPIGHRPELELAWLVRNASSYPLHFDPQLERRIESMRAEVVQ